MSAPPPAVLRIIMDSLRDRSDDWKITAHAARNERLGAEIWLSNRYYGTHLTIDGTEWGGLSMASSFFGWAMPWRRRLVRAVDNIAIARLCRRAAPTHSPRQGASGQ